LLMITLDEAIIHCQEVADTCTNKECANDHMQLKLWLSELKERREADGDGEMLLLRKIF
jgi:hypothetical protein